MADQTLATEKWCNQGTAGARSAPSDRTNSLARSHCGEPPTAPDQLWPSGLARNGNFDLLQLAGSAPAAAAKKWPATATWLQRASMWLALAVQCVAVSASLLGRHLPGTRIFSFFRSFSPSCRHTHRPTIAPLVLSDLKSFVFGGRQCSNDSLR